MKDSNCAWVQIKTVHQNRQNDYRTSPIDNNGFWRLFNIFAVFKSGQDTPLEGILPFDRVLMPTLVEVTVVFFIFITPFVAKKCFHSLT